MGPAVANDNLAGTWILTTAYGPVCHVTLNNLGVITDQKCTYATGISGSVTVSPKCRVTAAMTLIDEKTSATEQFEITDASLAYGANGSATLIAGMSRYGGFHGYVDAVWMIKR